MPSRARASRRTRAALSVEAILEATVELLDRDGVSGFTLRGLAQQLGGGLGSVYWYVDGKDELVARAANAVIAQALADIDAMRSGDLDPATLGADGPPPAARRKATSEALGEARRILLALFHQLEVHPWMGPHLQRDGGIAHTTNSLIMWDQVGQRLIEVGLTPVQAFYGSTALFNYVTGVGASMALRDQFLAASTDAHPDRENVFDQMVEEWLGPAEVELPFVRSIGPVLRDHDDFEQFVAGLDLLIAGLRLQAEAR